MVSRALRFSLAALVVAAAACTSREDAERALREAETAIAAQHADAIRYAPAAFREVMAAYAASRASLDSGRYREAVQQAEEVGRSARQLPAAITAGKEALRPQWEELSGNLAMMVTALDQRLAAVDRGRRPAGVTTAQIAEAHAGLDSLRMGVDRATAAWQKGDLSDAVHAATRLQTRGREVLRLLGVDLGPHGM